MSKSNDKSKKLAKSSRKKNLPKDLRSLLSKKTKKPLKDSKDGTDSGLEKDVPNEEKMVYKKLRITVEQNTNLKSVPEKKRKSPSPRQENHKRQKTKSEKITNQNTEKSKPKVDKVKKIDESQIKNSNAENPSKFQKGKQNVDKNQNQAVRSSLENLKPTSLSPRRRSVSPVRKKSKARSVSPKKKTAKKWQILDLQRVKSPLPEKSNGTSESEKTLVTEDCEQTLKNSLVEEIEILGPPQLTSTPLKADELAATKPEQPIKNNTEKDITAKEPKVLKKRSDPAHTKFLNAKIADELKKLEEEEPFYGSVKTFSSDEKDLEKKPKKVFRNPNFEAKVVKETIGVEGETTVTKSGQKLDTILPMIPIIETTHFVLDPDGPIFKGLKTSTDFASVIATKFRDAYIGDNNGDPQNASMLLDAFIVYRATKEEIAYKTLFIQIYQLYI